MVDELLNQTLNEIKRLRSETFERLLELAADLSDEQIAWRAGPHAPSIGFHLWHVARWIDLDRQQIEGGEQLWHAQRLAERWGINEAELGGTGAGTGMGDEASERLVLPSKSELVAYSEAVFGAFDRCMAGSGTEEIGRALVAPINPEKSETVVNVLVDPLQHDNRHLGMIEALRGVMGLNGSATD